MEEKNSFSEKLSDFFAGKGSPHILNPDYAGKS